MHVEDERPILGRGFEMKPTQHQDYLLLSRGLDLVLLYQLRNLKAAKISSTIGSSWGNLRHSRQNQLVKKGFY